MGIGMNVQKELDWSHITSRLRKNVAKQSRIKPFMESVGNADLNKHERGR